MQNATKKQNNKPSGFAVEITDATELGSAMLIVESEEGQYEPIALVATVREAREFAEEDLRNRKRRLEGGESPLCPYVYKVWTRGLGGQQRIASEILATEVAL